MSTSDLKQQVELLEFQLEDYRTREAQLQSRYDSLLASMGPCNLCAMQESRAEEAEAALQQTQRQGELALQDLQLTHEQVVLQLTSQITKLRAENTELSWKVKSLGAVVNTRSRQKDSKTLRMQITKLRSELTNLRSAFDCEVSGMKQLTEELFACMKEIYDEQCQRLRTQVAELQTRLREDDVSTEGEEGEDTVATLREQLRDRNAELEKLQWAFLQKFEQRGYSCKDCQTQLEAKERQVDELKRLTGELRIQLSSPASMKPPSPCHSRAVSHSPRTKEAPAPCSPQPPDELQELRLLATYRRMVSSCAKMQCSHCLALLPTAEFHDHVLVCRLETLSTQVSVVDQSESRVQALKLKIGQLRNERDRARLEAERLLVQLKSVKLDWALTLERKEERTMRMRADLKQIVRVLYRARETLCHNADLDNALLSLRELSREKC